MKLSKEKFTISFCIIMFVLLINFCIDNYLPSAPFIAKSLQININNVESAFLVTFIGMAVGLFIAGIFLVHGKRKKICLLGYAILLIGECSTLLAFNDTSFMISRFAVGVAIGLISNSFLAILTDSLKGDEFAKVNAIFMLMLGVMPIVSPFAGGLIETYLGWEFNFIIPVVLNACSVVLFLKIYKEVEIKEGSKGHHIISMVADFFYPIRNIKLLSVIIIQILIAATFYSYMAIGPQLFEVTFKLTPIGFASLAGFYTIAFIAGSTINTFFLEKLGLKKIMFYGCVIGLLGLAAMFIVSALGIFSIIAIVLPISIYFFGITFVFDNSLPMALEISTVKRGNPVVLFSFLTMAFPTFIGFLIVNMNMNSFFYVALIYLLMIIVSFIILLISSKNLKIKN